MTRSLVILSSAFLLAGCSNMGLDEGPIPLEEAMHAPPTELVVAVHSVPADADAEIVMDGRLWVPWGLPSERDRATLRPVGSTHGVTVFAYSWDRSPFDAVFTPGDDGWQGHAPIIGRSGGGPDH